MSSNFEKFVSMGFHNLPKGISTRVVVNELDQLDTSKTHMIKRLVNVSGETTEKSFHNVNTCLAYQEVFDFIGGEIEIHYTNDSWKNALKYARANNIKVVGRSATLSFLGEEDEKAIKEFNDWGGIFVVSAGNDRRKDNAPTDVPPSMISVGCVFEPDNSNSTVVVYSSLKLPSFTEGVDNIYTDTSGAHPIVGAVACIMSAVYGMNKDKFETWIKINALTNVDRLEVGERLLYVPVLESLTAKRVIELYINGKALVDGKEVPIDVPATITKGRTMLPARFVAENLKDCAISFEADPVTKSVIKVIITQEI